MRKFHGLLFLGSGAWSVAMVKVLHKRLDEALSMSGGLQQSSQGMPEDPSEQLRCEMDLSDAVRDIVAAVTGRDIVLTEKLPYPWEADFKFCIHGKTPEEPCQGCGRFAPETRDARALCPACRDGLPCLFPVPCGGHELPPKAEPKERHSAIFHRLWTRDVGTQGYNKELWKELERLLVKADSSEPERHTHATEYEMADCPICRPETMAPDPKKMSQLQEILLDAFGDMDPQTLPLHERAHRLALAMGTSIGRRLTPSEAEAVESAMGATAEAQAEQKASPFDRRSPGPCSEADLRTSHERGAAERSAVRSGGQVRPDRDPREHCGLPENGCLWFVNCRCACTCCTGSTNRTS